MYKGIQKISVADYKRLVKVAKQESQTPPTVIGETVMKKYSDSAKRSAKYKGFTWNDKEYLIKSDYIGFTSSYINVEDSQYIAVKTRVPFLVLFLGFVAGTGIFLDANKDKLDEIPLVGEAIQEYMGVLPEQEYMSISGLEDMYKLSEQNKELFLINPEGNSVYSKYTIYSGNEVILKTDYVEPNKMYKANLYDLLDSGTYHLRVIIESIDMEKHYECNAVELKTTVVIDK